MISLGEKTMDAPFRKKAREILQHKNCEITNHPHSLKNKIFGKRKKVTVVTAAYNAEKFISRTIDSVINQTLGFDQIQLIIVDDHSSDNTKKIVSEYLAKHKNICLVSLHENTGSPGTPRNIGIELADSAYITFLDADDWLAPGGRKNYVIYLMIRMMTMQLVKPLRFSLLHKA